MRGAVLVLLAASVLALGPARAAAAPMDLGPSVVVLDPGMPQSTIQAKLDAISAQQGPDQFGADTRPPHTKMQIVDNLPGAAYRGRASERPR